MRRVDKIEEAALEVDGDVFGDLVEVAHFGDERGLSGLEFGFFTEELSDVVTDGGTVETFRTVELIAITDRLGDAIEDDAEFVFHIFLAGGIDELNRQRDVTSGGTGALELLEDFVLSGDGVFAENVALGFLLRDRDPGILGDGLASAGPRGVGPVFPQRAQQ